MTLIDLQRTIVNCWLDFGNLQQMTALKFLILPISQSLITVCNWSRLICPRNHLFGKLLSRRPRTSAGSCWRPSATTPATACSLSRCSRLAISRPRTSTANQVIHYQPTLPHYFESFIYRVPIKYPLHNYLLNK